MADRREAARSSTGAAEADIWGGLTGCPSWCTRAQAPVRRGQNRSAPVDLMHLLHGGASDPSRGGGSRTLTSSKVTAISPRGSRSCASRGTTGPGGCRPAGSRRQSVTCALLVAKRPAWGPPQPSALGEEALLCVACTTKRK
jgi:hypothetical protein